MERGPLALFGAIVAVGLGPALWLGAQFGRFDVAPPRPPVPVDRTQDNTTTQLMGGAGGGENDTGDVDTPARATPQAHVIPMTIGPSATPSSSPTDPDPSTSGSDPGDSTPSDSPSATPSDPIDPPTGTGGDDSVPPSPPTSGGGPGGGNDGGTGGTGGGDVSGTNGGSSQTN
jgi:hypothetical protein